MVDWRKLSHLIQDTMDRFCESKWDTMVGRLGVLDEAVLPPTSPPSPPLPADILSLGLWS